VPLLGVALVFTLAYIVVPYPWTLAARNPQRTSLMEQRIREAEDGGASLEVEQQWVALEEISPNLVRAVIVAEDYRFREHRGVDWVSLAEEVRWSGDDAFSWTSPSDLGALARALGYVWSHRHEIRGRSTLTQQLAKNLYFGTDRSFLRKAMEFWVAGRLERHLGKDRILELYLNVVEWGPGIFGAEAAARAYFGRSASSLTLEEAASLAGTLPHPLTSNPARNPGRMLWRRDLILERLRPSSGIPSAPGPLPDIDIPEVEIGGLEGAAVTADTLRQDTVPPEPASDTLATDTVPPDTLRPDTVRLR